jgi:arginine-tRNA-protein transferase
MELHLRQYDCGPCPYLEGRLWRIEQFSTPCLDPGLYESLLGLGFRRSGMSFYRNTCDSCGLCIPIRLDTTAFRPSKTMRRLGRANADISVALVDGTAVGEGGDERFGLYRRYTDARHREEGEAPADPASYASFLVRSPCGPTKVSEYRLPDGRLAATGYLDLLPDGLSSVYFAFDPDFGKRSLGVWSVQRELELAASLGLRWYYLGFWVPGSRKMDYKARFTPFEYAKDGAWHPVPDRDAALLALGVA